MGEGRGELSREDLCDECNVNFETLKLNHQQTPRKHAACCARPDQRLLSRTTHPFLPFCSPPRLAAQQRGTLSPEARTRQDRKVRRTPLKEEA